MFDGKKITITGGTGSFGQRILKLFLNNGASEIRIFSRDEKKQEELRQDFQDPRVKSYIGDVRNFDSVAAAFRNVDYVFHAAALKQVPSCEFYPMEAIRTNVIGADNVVRAAQEQNVSRVVMLSTDKAVYPINAMGMTKALMEKVMVAQARNLTEDDTIFCATRYGNVMASRGSVIPLFISQIRHGQPITLTDPKMTRYLMSLDDSVDLVLHSFTHGNQGDIFVQKAPASTIGDLVTALKDLFESDVPVEIIGTRHGEKVFETLISREEMSRAEDMGRYYRVPADNRDLNYKAYLSEGDETVAGFDDYTSHNTGRLDVEGTKRLLMSIDYVQRELAEHKKARQA